MGIFSSSCCLDLEQIASSSATSAATQRSSGYRPRTRRRSATSDAPKASTLLSEASGELSHPSQGCRDPQEPERQTSRRPKQAPPAGQDGASTGECCALPS